MRTQPANYQTLLISKKITDSKYLSEQTQLNDTQRTNYIGRLERENNGATMFFISEKLEKTTFEFLQNSANIL